MTATLCIQPQELALKCFLALKILYRECNVGTVRHSLTDPNKSLTATPLDVNNEVWT